MTLDRYIISIGILTLCCITGCSEYDYTAPSQKDKEICLYLKFNNNFDRTGSRAITEKKGYQDEWSYNALSQGDIIGFYARTKSGGSLINVPFMLENDTINEGKKLYKFVPYGSDYSDWDVPSLSSSDIFIYLPYNKDVSEDEYGYALRTKKEPFSDVADYPDGPWRCVDFLTSSTIDASNLEDGTLQGELMHAFSELIIMRGDGFMNPPETLGDDRLKIWVKLKKPYTHIKVNVNKGSATTELTNDSNYKPDDYTGTFDASVWECWQGGNYGITDEDEHGYEAWYVVLPTIGYDTEFGKYRAGDRSQVEYIQLYDDQGILQTIKDLHLGGNNGNLLDAGWRYPMIVAMQDLVPTVFPFTIKEWNEGNITNKRSRGITQDTFANWLSAYNNTATSETTLALYGDKVEKAGGGSYWHFYLLDNIDLSEYTTGTCIIPKMGDVIDGKTSPTASPIIITGLQIPLIGEMSGINDSIKNIIISRPKVEQTTDTPMGVVVNYLQGGGINNCTIVQGRISNKSAAGIFVGNMEAGSITDCSATGVVIAGSSEATSGYLVGQWNGDYTFTGNNSSVVFSTTNMN